MCADPHKGYFARGPSFHAQYVPYPPVFEVRQREQGSAWNLPMLPGRTDTVAKRSIEMLIGRLITDERFRTDFLSAPEDTLNDLCALGLDLSQAEIAALLNTDMALWIRAASQIDPRLQKVNLSVSESR